MSRDRQMVIHELGAALRTYQRAVDAFDETVAAHLGVNRTDLRCLDVLLEQGQATPGYLADALGLTTGSVTAMLDRLEKQGYVERKPDPADRRRVKVRPSQDAVVFAEEIYGPLAQAGGQALSRHTRAELELLIGVLRQTQAIQESHTERIRAMRRERRPDAETQSAEKPPPAKRR